MLKDYDTPWLMIYYRFQGLYRSSAPRKSRVTLVATFELSIDLHRKDTTCYVVLSFT